jgi:hypothetical protein
VPCLRRILCYFGSNISNTSSGEICFAGAADSGWTEAAPTVGVTRAMDPLASQSLTGTAVAAGDGVRERFWMRSRGFRSLPSPLRGTGLLMLACETFLLGRTRPSPEITGFLQKQQLWRKLWCWTEKHKLNIRLPCGVMIQRRPPYAHAAICKP